MFAEVKRLNKGTAIRLAIAAGIAMGMVVVVLLITITRPNTASFCAKCHNDVTFNNACKKPLSKDIACIECHTHKNEGVAHLAVEIKDEHCTAESCHPLSKLSAQAVKYKKSILFQHKTHLAKLPGNLTLKCTSCHAHISNEKHFETDTKTCDTCHFINTTRPLYAQNKKPISDCALCHGRIEKTKDIYGKTFRHEAYEKNEKTDCSDCHFNIIQGDGRVDERNCYQCHAEISDYSKRVPDVHAIHIVKHKVACTSCHDALTHGWVTPGNPAHGNDSAQQPGAAAQKVQELIMMGMGGTGIRGEPDPMYLATLNCSACHKDKERFAHIEPKVCNNCHEKGFDKILTEQMRFVTSRLRLLRSLLTQAKRCNSDAASQAIHEAEVNYHLIREDGSSGAHNIKYIKYLLDYSITNLRQILEQKT
ncbi:MAG: hypothetical protein L3J18_16380 [Candidatus Brocadia sp.]|uniref:Heme protein n=1 Tax=Candidatus Brocadia fulgida TaxID=380242 RepID=A0A0M2UWW7_9BACT|nr:MAG: putative heme protein [Candidatus Brocadia fulgida]UJS20447.1 MAG: hypothetical protein L3J18_16380 [Candidatus Brocadia sp.]